MRPFPISCKFPPSLQASLNPFHGVEASELLAQHPNMQRSTATATLTDLASNVVQVFLHSKILFAAA